LFISGLFARLYLNVGEFNSVHSVLFVIITCLYNDFD